MNRIPEKLLGAFIGILTLLIIMFITSLILAFLYWEMPEFIGWDTIRITIVLGAIIGIMWNRKITNYIYNII